MLWLDAVLCQQHTSPVQAAQVCVEREDAGDVWVAHESLQMASRFFAVLHVEPEGIFTHADFRGYGVPEVSGVAVGPSDIPWEDSVVSCFPGVEYPQASQVKFAFYSPGADAFACQLDDRYVECASPYLTPHLQPGEHTFQVTPVLTQSRSVRAWMTKSHSFGNCKAFPVVPLGSCWSAVMRCLTRIPCVLICEIKSIALDDLRLQRIHD